MKDDFVVLYELTFLLGDNAISMLSAKTINVFHEYFLRGIFFQKGRDVVEDELFKTGNQFMIIVKMQLMLNSIILHDYSFSFRKKNNIKRINEIGFLLSLKNQSLCTIRFQIVVVKECACQSFFLSEAVRIGLYCASFQNILNCLGMFFFLSIERFEYKIFLKRFRQILFGCHSIGIVP